MSGNRGLFTGEGILKRGVKGSPLGATVSSFSIRSKHILSFCGGHKNQSSHTPNGQLLFLQLTSQRPR